MSSTSPKQNRERNYFLRLNGKPADTAIEFTSNGVLNTLLLKSRDLFGLQTPITIVYTENGEVVKRLDDVPDDSTLVLSCGEQFIGKLFYFVENGRPKTNREKPRYRSNGSLQKLLTDATSLLNLKQPAKIIFTEAGKRIRSLEEVPDGSTLVVSTGSSFVQAMSPKERKQKLMDSIRSSPQNNSTSPNNNNTQNNSGDFTSPTRVSKNNSAPASPISFDNASTRSSMTAITTSNATKSRYARYHQLLAVLPGSVEDHIRDSMLATYVSMPEEMKQSLENTDAYETMLTQTQIHLFTEQLVHQMICQQRSSSPVDSQICDWALNTLNEISMSDVHFAISGPRYSGKTMMLSTLSSILYRKIIASDERDHYMMFPFNFNLHALNLDSPMQLYPAIINITFNSARYARFELLPFLLNLRQWFLSASTYGTMTKLPPELSNIPNVDSKAILQLGKQFHTAFHTDTDINEFLNLMFSFPNNLAWAIGMKSAVYIIDHLDYSTPDAIKALSATIRTIPYIVASQNDKSFTKSFKVKNATQLFTENSIEYNDNREIYIPDLQLRFGAHALMGCPGFISSYIRLCELVENNIQMEEKSSLKGTRYSQIVPKIGIFRRCEAEQEFKKFALALAMANSTIITFDALNNIDDEQTLSIKIANRNSK
ncbi:hypothetical protein TRFO_21381 [Tritrichomonas foetus]|uniref:Doublecortin domain-containing protein n=1 Tax=Tritrichomonas foetus TaxID=1144522 RepID=A0A1J4KJ05_9EUKA|nr:hypothetical protein TRFO_21381 [Tritrichomonas foetus]|eukprot:OHT09662.1 hypothetical protein TRFO_21381 [Tritrichomonas foetus]